MKSILILVFVFFTTCAQAVGWGSFNGRNTLNEQVVLSPEYNVPNLTDKNVEDVISIVIVISTKGSKEFRDVCHRQIGSERMIWCNGNKESPLYGTTYKWVKLIRGPETVDYSDKQIWECSSGCTGRAPKKFIYEY